MTWCRNGRRRDHHSSIPLALRPKSYPQVLPTSAAPHRTTKPAANAAKLLAIPAGVAPAERPPCADGHPRTRREQAARPRPSDFSSEQGCKCAWRSARSVGAEEEGEEGEARERGAFVCMASCPSRTLEANSVFTAMRVIRAKRAIPPAISASQPENHPFREVGDGGAGGNIPSLGEDASELVLFASQLASILLRELASYISASLRSPPRACEPLN